MIKSESKPRNGSRLSAVQEFVRLVEGGTFRPGDRLPVERVLAEQLGVSKPTLHTVLQELEVRGVITKSKERGWQRRVVVGTPTDASILSQTVAVLTGFTSEMVKRIPLRRGEYESALPSYCLHAITEAGYHALLLHRDNLTTHTFARMARENTSGVVVLWSAIATPDGMELVNSLRDHGIAVVVNSYGSQTEKFDRVMSDHAQGAYDLTRFLIAKGCRRIVRYWVVRSNIRAAEWLIQRDLGYTRAMTEAGLEVLPAIHALAPEELDDEEEHFEVGKRLAMSYLVGLLNQPAPVDGILALNDGLFFAIAEAVQALGKAPQKDVLIVGYDNNWETSGMRKWTPFQPLATMDKKNQSVGQAMVQLVLERARRQLPEEPQCRLLKPELIIVSE